MNLFSTCSTLARPFRHAAPLLILLWVATRTPAATYIWTGGAANEYWSSAANWQGGVAPAANETGLSLVFSNGIAVRTITNDVTGLQVASLRFQGSNYVIHGKPSGNALTFAGATFGYAVTVNDNNNQFASTCPLVSGNIGVITVNGTNTLKLSSVVSGSGGIVKGGPGTLLFNASSDNTFSGGLTVSDGDVNLAAVFSGIVPRVAIPGPLTIGGASLLYSPRVQLLADNQLSANAAVTVNGNAQLRFNGHDSPLGNLTLQAGLVDTTVAGTNAGTLTLNGDVSALADPLGLTNSVLIGALDLGGANRVFDVATNTALELWASISGSALNVALTKTGGGALRMFNRSGGSTNTYSGTTEISEGVVELNQAALGSSFYGTTVSSNAQLIVWSASTNAEALTLHGNDAAATLVVNDDCTWIHNLTLVREVGVTVAAGKKLRLQNVINGSGGLRLNGPGTTTLAGASANVFGGVSTISAGTLELNKGGNSANAVSGDLVINGGTVIWLGYNQFLNNKGLTINAPGIADLDGHFDSVNSLSGDGHLNVSASQGLSVVGSVDCTFAGQITGDGYLQMNGLSALTLSGNSGGFTGKVYVLNGTVNVTGNYSQSTFTVYNTARLTGLAGGAGGVQSFNSGIISPGVNGPALVPVSGGFYVGSSNATVEMDIQGGAPGTGYDQFILSNWYVLGGPLKLNLNYAAAVGEQFTLLKQASAQPHSGAFIGLPEQGLITTNGNVFQITYKGGAFGGDVILTRVSTNAPQLGHLQRLVDGKMQLAATGSPNAIYSVWAAASLNPATSWSFIGTAQANAAAQLNFTDANAASYLERFYRLTLP